MASRGIVSQVAEGRAKRPFPYVGYYDYESYRKDLYARPLYALMDSMGFSDELQKMLVEGDFSVYCKMNKKGGRRNKYIQNGKV